MAKTIGIIGGMGPAATIDLLTKIYANSSADCDQQHPRVLADIDPSIPDRTAAILAGRGEEVISHLLGNARGLIAQGADLLAMPCNTAHAFIRQLEGELSVPFVSIIDVTVEHVLRSKSGGPGLLATDGTIAARLYIDQFLARGVSVHLPGLQDQTALMGAIYAFKGGDLGNSVQAATDVYQKLLQAGADRVIAACTELPILLEGQEFVDPTQLLAKELVNLALNG